MINDFGIVFILGKKNFFKVTKNEKWKGTSNIEKLLITKIITKNKTYLF